MVRSHLIATTISNRTQSSIRFTHHSFTTLVPPLTTTPTRAIESHLPLTRLSAYVTIEDQKEESLEIKFKRAKTISKRRARTFKKLEIVQTLPSDPIPGGSHDCQKGDHASGFHIYQSVSKDGSVTFMVIKARKMSDWMSELPEDIPISSLTLPGSHNTCALYGWPIGTCQTRSLRRQLEDGIRFLDVRLALPKGPDSNLVAYHGIRSQFITFHEINRILNEFLRQHPSESLVMSIKQEDFTPGFAQAVEREISISKVDWWLDDQLPSNLGEARGKVILFSRFGRAKNRGVHLPIWPNNSNQIWETDIPGTHIAVQDWYQIGSFLSIRKKSELVCVSLVRAFHGNVGATSSPAPNRNSSLNEYSRVTGKQQSEEGGESMTLDHGSELGTRSKIWVINYLSASSLLFGFPNIVAKGFGFPKSGLGIEGINTRVARWLIDRRDQVDGRGGRRHGVVCLMDFYQSPKDTLVSLLVDCNF